MAVEDVIDIFIMWTHGCYSLDDQSLRLSYRSSAEATCAYLNKRKSSHEKA